MMDIYKHSGSGDYAKSQIKTYKQKSKSVWVAASELKIIANHIKINIPNASFGLCHGVRTGYEVEELRRLLGIEVIGTEIATDRGHVIKWDFHETKDGWIDSVDFIYSNAFDHSHSPEACLDSWMSCIKQEGVCYIHWSNAHNTPINAADCFSANRNEYRKLFNAKYKIIDEINAVNGRIVFAVRHNKRIS